MKKIFNDNLSYLDIRPGDLYGNYGSGGDFVDYYDEKNNFFGYVWAFCVKNDEQEITMFSIYNKEYVVWNGEFTLSACNGFIIRNKTLLAPTNYKTLMAKAIKKTQDRSLQNKKKISNQ